MCGIAAIFSPNIDSVNFNKIDAILARMHFRGDSTNQGEKKELKNCVLGCNRLPFTSLKFNHQPQMTSNQQYNILLSGELYDFHGRMQSDIYLLSKYFEDQQRITMKDIDGIFANIIYDSFNSTIYLCRDQFGVKPLYYSFIDNDLICASEIKALSFIDEIKVIYEVPPGKVLLFKLGNKNYNIIEDFDYRTIPTRHLEENDLIDRLSSSLVESIKSQSLDQDTYGIFLSGGLDSSGIYSILRQLHNSIVPITLGNANSPDLKSAKQISMDNIENVPCPSEEAIFDTIHQTIQIVETFEPNVVRQSGLSRIISQKASNLGIRAVFCGEGADEIFGGYPEFNDKNSSLSNNVRNMFLQYLHRTQLQRVDRTSMNETVEVRVPYLSKKFSNIALSVNINDSNKNLLRKVVKKCTNLPSTFLNRPKAIFSEGAGIGGNDPSNGMFKTLITNCITDKEAHSIINENPSFNLKTKEEAFYFKIFQNFGYQKHKNSKDRVFANTLNSNK